MHLKEISAQEFNHQIALADLENTTPNLTAEKETVDVCDFACTPTASSMNYAGAFFEAQVQLFGAGNEEDISRASGYDLSLQLVQPSGPEFVRKQSPLLIDSF
jgi:hypothetical protein